jgi:hypothetical protein
MTENDEAKSMPRKSEVGWLVEPGVREIPRKAIEEAKELLAQGKEYARHVVRAWLERKAVKWNDYVFRPKGFGVEVYRGDEYETSWKNRAIEIAFYKLALEEQALLEATAKARGAEVKAEKKTSDEDQVDVDVVVNVEAPKQAKDVEGGDVEVEGEDEDIVEVEDIDVAEEEELEE